MMGKDLLLQPVITAILCFTSSRGTEKLEAQGTTVRQLTFYTNEPKRGSVFKKSVKGCTISQKLGNSHQCDSPASKFAAPFKGRKVEAEIRLVSGLSFWNNLKRDTEFSSQAGEELQDGKDPAGEMLS